MEDGIDGARVGMSTIQAEDAAIIETLAVGPLHRFADWPHADVPAWLLVSFDVTRASSGTGPGSKV